MRTPRITAEADIGGRDESVVLDNFRLDAQNVFPGSIEGTRVANKRLVLDMTRPTTMPGDENRERCHAQIRTLFAKIGLYDVVIEEYAETGDPRFPQAAPVLAMTGSSEGTATHTTA